MVFMQQTVLLPPMGMMGGIAITIITMRQRTAAPQAANPAACGTLYLPGLACWSCTGRSQQHQPLQSVLQASVQDLHLPPQPQVHVPGEALAALRPLQLLTQQLGLQLPLGALHRFL